MNNSTAVGNTAKVVLKSKYAPLVIFGGVLFAGFLIYETTGCIHSGIESGYDMTLNINGFGSMQFNHATKELAAESVTSAKQKDDKDS